MFLFQGLDYNAYTSLHSEARSGKYISALLLSLTTMLHLELPHINVLSKMDLIESCERLDFAGLHLVPGVQHELYMEEA